MHSLTLVSPDLLTDGAVEPLLAAASEALAAVGAPDRLHPRAVDIPCDAEDPKAANAALRAALADKRLDFALQPSERRRKRLLVADMESTVIHNEMLDELADFVNCREQVVAITARAMNGELDFHRALEERVALLEGLDGSSIDAVRSRIRLDSGARTLLDTLRAHGVKTALVSGGFDVFVEPVADELGFDTWQANRLEIKDGRLSGRPVPPILDKSAKLDALRRLCAEGDFEPADACTVGDGANDLLMLQAAGLGTAYHGKKSVAEAAPYRIDHNDLTALLFFQGYREDELK